MSRLHPDFYLTSTRHKTKKGLTKSKFLKPRKCNIFLEFFFFQFIFLEEKYRIFIFLEKLMHKNAIKLKIFGVGGKYLPKGG